MTHYKATRLDGTDLYTGTVDYAAAVGSVLSPSLPTDNMKFPGPAWLHLATVPTECVGAQWPGRLFEVEPRGTVISNMQHPHKIGCRSVRVVREVDAHLMLGPQGREAAAVIERSSALTRAEAEALYATRAATRDATWDATWDAAWAAAWDATREAAWDATRDATRAATRAAAWAATREATWDAAWAATWAATWDAAEALIARDLIGQHPGWDQVAYDLLTRPWRTAIGPVHPDDEPIDGSA